MKIIINFPTNLGDAIMSLTVLDAIKTRYFDATITAIVSPRTKQFLIANSFIDEVILFRKEWSSLQKMRFVLSLRGKYDLIVDLKNTFIPALISAKRRTPFIRNFKKIRHSKDRYLSLLKGIAEIKKPLEGKFNLDENARADWDNRFKEKHVFLACSSLSHLKQYPYDKLKELVDELSKRSEKVVVLGQDSDRDFYKGILSKPAVIDLVGKTSMVEVWYLLKNFCKGIVCVDSGILHLASYLDLPVVALFGPTDDARYGPWSARAVVLKNDGVACAPCSLAQCPKNVICMRIEPGMVIEQLIKLGVTQ
ncbi:MAG: glycosyltransferase family 9 protein [Candidatus Omnitrophica bacterium]|nr:glycosyltransferase family 9 protein [Candidatus Omnitrophota bacterium]